MSEKHFEKMISLLEEMNQRLKNIEVKLSGESTKISSNVSSIDLLKIPKSHLATYFAVQKLGKATCKEVADETGKSHTNESNYLVYLKKLGFLDSERISFKELGEDKQGSVVRYFVKENDVK